MGRGSSMDTIRLGIILIVIGFSVVLLGSLQGAESSASVGGMVMIGPIPIIFGSSPLITLGVAIVGLVMMILYIFSVRQER